MIDLLIRGGTVVLPAGPIQADIAIDGDTISSIGRIAGPARRTIDAGGKLVLPGLVDAHVHLQLKSWDAVSANGWYSGTVAAALGGVTTVIDFATQGRGRPMMEAVAERQQEADGDTVIDYGLHMVITEATPTTLDEVEQVIQHGLPSFKMFMTYRAHNVMSDDDDILRICSRVSECKGLPGVHAENTFISEGNYSRFEAAGLRNPRYHALAKPDYVEAEAINRALFLARVAGSPLYIYHLSTALGVDLVRRARKMGQQVLAETCTHYLILTRELLERPDGVNWICSPPLRDMADQQALWSAVTDGTVAVISTDEAGFTAADKALASDSRPLDEIPNGLPGIELRLPLVFTSGVQTGRLSLQEFVALNCTNPARIFGLYPRKGVIAAGSDADLIIIDPSREIVLSTETQHMPVDWCAYEGMKLIGYPAYTISRGQVLVSDYQFCGHRGHGRFVPGRLEEGYPAALF